MPPLPPRNCSQHAGDRRCPGRAAAQCWFCEQWFCGDHITVTPCAKPICHVDAAIKRIFAAWKARTQQASQVRPERPRMIVVAGRQRVSSWVPTGPHTYCPEPKCGSPDVWVAYFAYRDTEPGWVWACHACGAEGTGVMVK